MVVVVSTVVGAVMVVVISASLRAVIVVVFAALGTVIVVIFAARGAVIVVGLEDVVDLPDLAAECDHVCGRPDDLERRWLVEPFRARDSVRSRCR